MVRFNSLILILFLAMMSREIYGQDKPTKFQQMALDFNREQFVILKKKENFRTNCDTSQMKLTVLGTRYEAMGGEGAYGKTKPSKQQKQVDLIQATNVGIEGCGHKAIYIYTNAGWVLNSSEEKK